MCLAVPGKILDIAGEDPLQRLGRVSFGGVVKEVNLACVPEAKVGDYVIVHVGLAISTVDEQEAQQVFEYLREMGDLAELGEQPGRSAGPRSQGTNLPEPTASSECSIHDAGADRRLKPAFPKPGEPT